MKSKRILILFSSFLLSVFFSGSLIAGRQPAKLEPASGAYFGVNLDWSTDSPSAYDQRLGHKAAVFVQFFNFPFKDSDVTTLDTAVQAVREAGGMLMITLEPYDGLGAITEQDCRSLASRLAAYNNDGVAIFVRFAHEMNGSWYPWSQQPAAYVRAFRWSLQQSMSRLRKVPCYGRPITAVDILSMVDNLQQKQERTISLNWIPTTTGN
jgi:hypothetical protein